MNKATVYAKTKNTRISPKKIRPVMDLVRGLPVAEAERVLTFDRTKGAKILNKTLKAAIANAKNNLDLKPENLYIADLYADEGRYIRTGRAAPMGRFSPIIKRSSHIVVGLSERTKSGK